MNQVALMICYARSGGTMLNRCLGSLENSVVLSEVNPSGGGWGREQERSNDTPYKQALNWYGIKLESKEYLESIHELCSYCSLNGKHLIIRDWPWIDFNPIDYYDSVPSFKLQNLKLLQTHLNVKPFAFVRDGIDVWISKGCPEPDDFFGRYEKYLQELKDLSIPIFRYEDFVINPSKTLKKILQSIGIPYKVFPENFHEFNNLNGDIQNLSNNKSRGIDKKAVVSLKRKEIPSGLAWEVNQNLYMKKCQSLMNYRPQYYSRTEVLKKEIRFHLNKNLNRFKLVKYTIPTDMQWSIDQDGNIDEKSVDFWIGRILKKFKRPIFYDIGANWGYYSLKYSRNIKQGYAFEPVKSTFGFLESNILASKIKSIKPINMGLGIRSELIEINLYNASGCNSMYERDVPEDHPLKMIGTEKISIEVLDELVKRTDMLPPDLIKIDVEGNELNVLVGARELLKIHQPIIIMEYSESTCRDAGYDRVELVNYLLELDYKIKGLDENNIDMNLIDLEDFSTRAVANIVGIPSSKVNHLI